MKRIAIAFLGILVLAGVSAAKPGVVKEDTIAAYTRVDMERIVEYALENDKAAIFSMMEQGRAFQILAGGKIGVLLLIEELAKVHRFGETKEFWMCRWMIE